MTSTALYAPAVAEVCLRCERAPSSCPEKGCEAWRAAYRAATGGKRSATPGTCLFCGAAFVGGARAYYCSGRCRNAAHRARQRDRRRGR